MLRAKIISVSADLDESIFDLGIWKVIPIYQLDLASITSVCARITLNRERAWVNYCQKIWGHRMLYKNAGVMETM